MYNYFVSYIAGHGDVMSHGHAEITMDRKIKGIEEIRNIAKSIEEGFDHPEGSVVILNFKRFDE